MIKLEIILSIDLGINLGIRDTFPAPTNQSALPWVGFWVIVAIWIVQLWSKHVNQPIFVKLQLDEYISYMYSEAPRIALYELFFLFPDFGEIYTIHRIPENLL